MIHRTPRSFRSALTALLVPVALGGAAIGGGALVAHAVSTRSFVIEDHTAFAAGELTRAAAFSDGTVRASVDVRRLPLADTAIAWSLARAADGTAYIGTGNDGRIWRLRGEELAPFAETGQLVVSSLALADDGTLYAGTLPEGRIFAVDTRATAPVTARALAQPEGAQHVWALRWDARRRTLFAGTGPEGKVFAVSPQGQSELWLDAEQAHVMSLALEPGGALYAGTSDGALVLKITAAGRSEVLFDLPGTEVDALALRNGALVAAANEFADAPGATAPPASPSPATAARPTPPRARAGKGKVFHLDADGRAEVVLASDDGHFTSVELAADGTTYVGAGKDGRVHRILTDHSTATWIDVDERQVLAIDLGGRDPLFLTGDVAAVYRVAPGTPAQSEWTSKVLDAGFRARFGQLAFRGEGALSLQTRSGNTERPDTTWSEWSAAITTPGPVRSPASRYLQIRARLGAPDTVLRSVTAWYLPQNQRAFVRDVVMAAHRANRPAGDASGADDVPAPSTQYRISWRVENPDGDRVRYRIAYRAEGRAADEQVWREILRESEVHTRLEHTWETSGVPDGWYRLRVRATDELANPAPYVLTDSAESGPVLVDNHAPRLEGLTASGSTLRGRALDDTSAIARLEASVDGGEWRMFFPDDDLLDTQAEAFSYDLAPLALAPGAHVVAVRAVDGGGNAATADAVVRIAGPANPRSSR
jgi:outer membrane protein assembly factor BamB